MGEQKGLGKTERYQLSWIRTFGEISEESSLVAVHIVVSMRMDILKWILNEYSDERLL